ncbi:S8 family serine peptidase [Streptomyces goshikiensis]|uniref:S8 family serine peptidase n=1 Tax=Streptomyces goshikiensis TaxID=1942 RepID=UPI0036B27905
MLPSETRKSTDQVNHPAATPGVVGAGAVNADGAVTDESERGLQVDMSAPGIDIVTACAGKTRLCASHGTSDASALVSASAALPTPGDPGPANEFLLPDLAAAEASVAGCVTRRRPLRG